MSGTTRAQGTGMSPKWVAVSVALCALCSTAHADYPLHIDDKVLFDMRLGMGSAEDSTTGESGFGMDLIASLRLGLDARSNGWRLTALPEVGVTSFTTDRTTGTFFVGGVGVGWVKGPWVMGVVPSYIGGKYQNPTGTSASAHGVRATALIELTQIIGVQVSVQHFSYYHGDAEQVMVTGSLNLIPLLILLRAAGG